VFQQECQFPEDLGLTTNTATFKAAKNTGNGQHGQTIDPATGCSFVPDQAGIYAAATTLTEHTSVRSHYAADSN
jgi:hypothetical protein